MDLCVKIGNVERRGGFELKANSPREALNLEDIPSVGRAIVNDLKMLGITKPAQLKNMDGIKLYEKLNRITGKKHDPCVADVFMAAVGFMSGSKARPWWKFTSKRKGIMNRNGGTK